MTDREHMRMLFGMFVFNGLLSRLNPDEIEVEDVWEFVEHVITAGESEPMGIVAIKTRKKKNA